MHKLIIKNNYILLFIGMIIVGFLLDYYWIKIYDLIPAWDQGYHLSNLYRYSNLLQELNIFYEDWWSSFWSITDSYRGPLTYIVSAIFINLFGKTLDNSILSNFIFNLITILSIYEICRKYFTKEIGLWATYIYTFNPFIFNLRNDYLIDISQVSFIMANWLFLTKWYFSNKSVYKYSFLSGIFAGLLFLTKPTAIVFFILPISILYLRKITSFKFSSSKFILELLIFPISFIFIIYPWVSKNWLTIITSIINSFSWGLKYQEGLEINTIEGWYYYPLEIFKILNPILIFSIIFLYLINIYKQKFSSKSYFNFSNILNKLPKNINWWIALPLNILLINILMSSKDPRFILPVIPLLCILMGKIIYNFRNKYYLSINSKIYLIILIIILLITQQFNTYNSKFSKSNNLDNKANIIHKEIVNTVSKESPYLDNIIGFIPDTKEFNAFNLNAEALRINNHIKVSQIISNKNTYESELKRYDWFIVKTADQGVMVNEGKKKTFKFITPI